MGDGSPNGELPAAANGMPAPTEGTSISPYGTRRSVSAIKNGKGEHCAPGGVF